MATAKLSSIAAGGVLNPSIDLLVGVRSGATDYQITPTGATVTVSGTTKTLALSDGWTIQDCTNASAQTITIPTNASVAYPIGTVIQFEQNGAGVLTITATGGVTLNGVIAGSAVSSGQYSSFYIRLVSADVWYCEGTSVGAVSGTLTVTSTSATALTVGASGATNPVFTVNANTASVITGLNITGAATGGTTTLTATDSGANAGLTLAAKGSGVLTLKSGSNSNITLLGTTGANIQPDGNTRMSYGTSNFNYTFAAVSSGVVPNILYTGAADTALTASNNAPIVFYNFAAATRQHATGSLTIQRDFRILGATDSFVGASTLTDSIVLALGLKSAGTNATVTNSSGLYIPTIALTGTVTNSYGLNIAAASGATNNYAAVFTGQVVNGGTTPTIAAGAGAGTSPTLSVAGSNNGGVLTLTTGTTPSGSNAIIATITFTNPFPTGCSVVLWPANAVTAAISGTTGVYVAGTTTTFVVTSGTVGLTGSTAYLFNYQVIGY